MLSEKVLENVEGENLDVLCSESQGAYKEPSKREFDRILYESLHNFMELGSPDGVRGVGELCLEEGLYYDASLAFRFLNDREGMLRVLRSAEDEDHFALEDISRNYLGSDAIDVVEGKFDEWVVDKGLRNEYTLAFDYSVPTVNVAHKIASDYDVGVGIAKGGLFSAYVFNLFGLPVKIAEAHKKGRGATFDWISEVERKDFEGKKVIAFDKDVVSGRTSRRVLKEIEKNNPKSVDLFLNYDFEKIASKIPKGYGTVYHSENFRYSGFDKAVGRLERSLHKGNK
jgi:hypothetical protein